MDSNNRPLIRVFVSSTYLDNVERRKVVQDAILAADMEPVGMERFTAAARPTLKECQRLAAECHVFVGIAARRYGWIPSRRKVSISELEYDAAKAAGRPRLMFVLSDLVPADVRTDYDDGPDRWDKQKKLDAFKKRFSKDQMPCVFEDATLGTRVLKALQDWQAEHGPSAATPATAPTLPPEPNGHDLATEIRQYCVKAEAFHRDLPIAGFKTRIRVPIDLAELHVPLHAMVDLRAVGEARRYADADEAEQALRGHEAVQEVPLSEAFRVAATHGARRGLVILGDPGSGKTTHLKRVLLACLREGPESIGLPKGMLPVFLPLRDLRPEHRELAHFVQAQLEQPHLGTATGFGKRLTDRQNLLLLLDGLDEVVHADRRVEVARWIADALTAHRDCRFVVTSRFSGYTPEVARAIPGHFLELHVRPLNEEQVAQFVRHWYRLVETGVMADRAQALVVATQRANDLLTRLAAGDFRARRVSELTHNPLLLANLCLVHRDRGQLPRRRADLYDECLDVLLERWREAKQIPPTITAKQGRRVLQPAALWLHGEEQRTRATAEELAPVMEEGLRAVRWDKSAAEFLQTVRDESGLLTGWGDQQYGFMHLGFQEYLAAQEVRRRWSERDDGSLAQGRGALAELARHFGEGWWQEVGLLLLATGNPSVFVPYMREVVKQPAFATNAALVEACLEDAAEVSVVPFRELVEVTPGQDRELWARQMVALRVLAWLDAEAVTALRPVLERHPSPALQTWLRQRVQHAAQEVIRPEPSGYELVLIPGGTFWMGSPESEEGRFPDEGPQHQVTASPFYLGRHPVTNADYGRFLAKNPQARRPRFWEDRRFNRARQPVVGVSWDDAQAYATWAALRLPTEAEWEYGCRAGMTTAYSSGDSEADLARVGWHIENSRGAPHEVGEKPANAFGLHDMHGNVWEWCADWFGEYAASPQTDPTGPPSGPVRVYRGGSWDSSARDCRSASRNRWHPDARNSRLGVRLAAGQPGGLARQAERSER